MPIRLLTPIDALAFQTLRLFALRDSPSAFCSSYDEEKDIPVATIEAQLAVKPNRGVFGAFEDDKLVGTVGFGRENTTKLAHKMFVWGMYVAPKARGRGVARALLLEAVSLAESIPDVKQIKLSVNTSNTAAIRLYESVGFRVYGCEPGALFINGEPHDETHMYLRLEDVPPVHSHIRR